MKQGAPGIKVLGSPGETASINLGNPTLVAPNREILPGIRGTQALLTGLTETETTGYLNLNLTDPPIIFPGLTGTRTVILQRMKPLLVRLQVGNVSKNLKAPNNLIVGGFFNVSLSTTLNLPKSY